MALNDTVVDISEARIKDMERQLKESRKLVLEQTIRACQSELQAMAASMALIKTRNPLVNAELQAAVDEYNGLKGP